MTKLLILSEFFYPDKSSTPKVLTELAEDLIGNGIEVKVITSKHSYKESIQYSNNESFKGIDIKRISSSNMNRNSMLGRVVNYITFTVSLFFNLIKENSYDAVLVVSNPPLIPFASSINKFLKRKPYYYLVHDVYPDIAVAVNAIKKDGFLYKIMNVINNVSMKNAEKIIVLGKDMKELFVEKGVKENKIQIIPNWSIEFNGNKVVNDLFYRENKLSKNFNVLYTGNIGRFHDVETILAVAKEAKEKLPDVRFIFIGDGFKKAIIEKAIKEGLNNVVQFGYKYDQEYIDILLNADMFISTLSPKIKGMGVPSKTYTYMAAGKPIVAIMEKGTEIGDLVEEYDIGIRVNSMEIDPLINYISSLIEDDDEYNQVVKNVNRLFKSQYERSIVTKQFVDLIK